MSDGPQWPTTEPDSETLRNYWLARGEFLTGLIDAVVEAGVFRVDPSHPLGSRYSRAVNGMIAAHDIAYLLAELRAADPDRADAASARLWCAADAGDGYGEWLWQWCDERGLDAQALYDAGRRDIGDAGAPDATTDGSGK